MFNLTRRSVLHAAGSAVFASALPALAGDQKLKIEVAFGNAYWKEMFQEVIDAFSRIRPDVTIALRPMANEPELSQTILRDAIVGTLPDIAFQGYGQMRATVDGNLAIALDPLIAKAKDWQSLGYVSSVSAMGQIAGRTYGIPFWASVPVMYYNLDMVEKAGGDPDRLPADWDAVLDLAGRMKAAAGGKQCYHYIYNNTDWNFQTLLFSEGGHLMSADERIVAFDGPEGLAAFSRLAEFGKAGMIAMSRDQARQSFAAGEIGILGGNASSQLGALQSQAKGKFKLGVGLHPMPSKSGTLPSGGGAFLILAKNKDKQAAAWEFIKFATGPIGQTIMVKKTGAVPVNEIAIRDPDLLASFYNEQPIQKMVLDSLPTLTAWYAFPGKNSNRIVTEIVDSAERAVRLQDSPEHLVDDLKVRVSALLTS